MERIDGHTLLIGLMAYPIRHSMSPTMHNNAFAKLGLNYAYLAFEIDNDKLEDAVQSPAPQIAHHAALFIHRPDLQ